MCQGVREEVLGSVRVGEEECQGVREEVSEGEGVCQVGRKRVPGVT